MANRKKIKAPESDRIDPLFSIFEQHLFNIADPGVDRKTFVTRVVNDYLQFLRKKNVLVPRSLEAQVTEELCAQVNSILVRKIYGFQSIDEFRKDSAWVARRRAKKRYQKLAAG